MADSGIAKRRRAALEDGAGSYVRRRGEIIAAAAVVFKQRGYRGTNLADVARAIGTDRASLYYYVSSKEELFEAVVSDVVEAHTCFVEEVRDRDVPAPTKLRTVVEAMMASFADNYPFVYVYLQENLSQVAPTRTGWAARMRLVNQRYESALEAIVQQGFDAGTLRSVAPAREIAYGVIGMVAWTNRWFDPNHARTDAATIGRGYADVIVGGLCAT